MHRRAKIMATLGPVSRNEDVLTGLIHAGLDLIRLNFSHGSHEEHRKSFELVRRLGTQEKVHLPIVIDLMGPRYRLGIVPGDQRVLVAGEEIYLGTEGGEVDLPIEEGILEYLAAGERVLIDGGLIELRVESILDGRVRALVINGGVVKTKKGINLPDSNLPFEVSEKDRADIGFAVAHGAEYLAASYVGAAAHIEALRAVIAEAGGRIPIIAKLERVSAIERLEEIVEAADGVMVARGDLGVEVPLYQVPVLQKRIIEAGRKAGKPVIVATQMLESMIEQPRPTRAEATDVANAVFDGADALMLSGETAVGNYPVRVIETMARIILEAEAYARTSTRDKPTLQPLGEVHARRTLDLDATEFLPDADRSLEVPDLVSSAAAYIADELNVSHIVAFSQSGFTARLVARYRPSAPIIAFTPDLRVARQVQLVWGVRPLLARDKVGSLDDVVNLVERQLLAQSIVEPGGRILILMGHPIHERPLTNLMRVHRIRAR